MNETIFPHTERPPPFSEGSDQRNQQFLKREHSFTRVQTFDTFICMFRGEGNVYLKTCIQVTDANAGRVLLNKRRASKMMSSALRSARRLFLETSIASVSHPRHFPSAAVLFGNSSFDEQSWMRSRKWGTNFQAYNFSSKGKKNSKSDNSGESGEEKLSAKEAALQAALSHIASTFGKEAVMWLGRSTGPRNVPVISTGSLGLDIALGIGGFPKGRVVEIYGPEASGKTTLGLHVIAESQKSGGICVFIDAEHALDESMAQALGVDTKNLLLSQPDCGEQALGLVDTFIRSGSVDVVVVDSVAALVPRSELEGEMGDAHMAVQARLMSQALRKLSHSLSRSQTLLIFINQVRAKLGTFGGFGGPTEVTSGGNALKFYTSVRLNIRRIGSVKKGEEIIGNQTLVKVIKNKLAPPFKTAEFELEFGRGISCEAEILELGSKCGLVSKSASFYRINGEHFRGKEAAKKYLREHHDVRDELRRKIREANFEEQGDTCDLDENSMDTPPENAYDSELKLDTIIENYD